MMLKKFCLAAAACVFFFLILEGLCSSLFVAYQLWSPEERRTMSGPSMQYDKELGWVSVANFYEKNYYAPNIDLRTNSRGFRAHEEFTERVPPGKLRIICSGDSFTFGEGVENNHTWCQDLESIDDRLQTVNMAESGYGVDQMYLRYKREGSALDHDVHVYAFITEDFRRMQLTNYVGYGKPVLKLRNGELVADNIPVPRQSRFLSWLGSERIQMRELRSVHLLGSLVGRVLPARDSAFSNGPTDEQSQILDKMFESLETMEKQRNSVLVLACLPTTLHDFEQGGPSPAWRAWVREESAKRDIVFVDLIDDFQKLPVTMKDGLFIWPGSVQYFAEAPGHYDDQGNDWVAKKLYAKLISIPEVAEKLGSHSEGRVAKPGVASGTRIANTHALSN
jgi:hypothetical protein